MRSAVTVLIAVLWVAPAGATPITAALFDGFQGSNFGGPTGGLGGLDIFLHSTFGSTLISQEFNLFEDFQHLEHPDSSREAVAVSFLRSHASNSELVLIGHSRGGEETQTLAQQLMASGVPIALTVQIDPVYFNCLGSLTGDCVQTLTPGIRQAFNYYETNSLGLSGDHPILGAQNVDLSSTGDCHISIAGCTGIAQDPRVWSLIAADISGLGPPSAIVPEPGTWTLVMLGLLVLGMAVRNRRAAAYAAAPNDLRHTRATDDRHRAH